MDGVRCRGLGSGKRTTSRGWGTRGKSTSAKPKSVGEVSGGAGSYVFDMTRANTRIRRFWEGGRIKDADDFRPGLVTALPSDGSCSLASVASGEPACLNFTLWRVNAG